MKLPNASNTSHRRACAPRLFAQITALLQRMLAAGPLVLYLDDLHWSDPTSLELLQSLLPLTGSSPLMVLTAFRPGCSAAILAVPSTGQTGLQRPLPRTESRAAVRNTVTPARFQSAENRRPARKNPFKNDGEIGRQPLFVEEVIRSLLDDGLIVQENEPLAGDAEIDHISLPDTLIGVITARLDRLPDDTRRILQAAAVLGREFSAGVLGEILSTGQESLENALTELQRRELVREIRPQPQQVFSFKHVLTQEAAYQSILLSSRRELHRLAAEAILSHTPNAAAEIAHHLLEARQAERALPYLIKAGDQSNLTHALSKKRLASFKKRWP
jgi:predicted ATPase